MNNINTDILLIVALFGWTLNWSICVLLDSVIELIKHLKQ